MQLNIDLQQLAQRESEQVEWKENVADSNDIVASLVAFANDLQNLGGGYVVCGAREDKDEHGFPLLVKTGLTASRLKEVEGKVIQRCRDLVTDPITPHVVEVSIDAPERRILVFIQPATGKAHSFRKGNEGERFFVRRARRTEEARNGLLRELLVRKGALEPWDRRPCEGATVNDLDLLVLRDTLQRMGIFSPDRGVEPYLSDEVALSPFVPPLCSRERMTGLLRPRNFTVLLFGRETQRFIPGAVGLFSIYPGVDRSDSHAERQELAGNLLEQARRLTELLDIQSYTAFDKNDPTSPNAIKYPKKALYEALGNALAHRNYELPDPTRFVVFSDRIEVLSPGALPSGVDPDAFREGRAEPKWRNQALAWFFTRLQLAQAEGQGIPTIFRAMREQGCPPPILEADEARVRCVLPAHPRHAVLQALRGVEQSLALDDLSTAQEQLRQIMAKDPLNYRAVQLFAEVQYALGDPAPVESYLNAHRDQIEGFPAIVLLQLAEALMVAGRPSPLARALAQTLLLAASKGRLEERELRRIVVAMNRSYDYHASLSLLGRQLQEHPEWKRNASLLQLRGDALLGMAKSCRHTGNNPARPLATRQRAWRQFHEYLARAESDLREALTLSLDESLTRQIRRNLEYLNKLRRENTLPKDRKR